MPANAGITTSPVAGSKAVDGGPAPAMTIDSRRGVDLFASGRYDFLNPFRKRRAQYGTYRAKARIEAG